MNAVIHIDPKNLGRRLETIQPMQLCNFRLMIVGVPSDMAKVSVAIYRPDGERFEAIPCTQDDNGDWYAVVSGACFPNAGEAKYQIGMFDAEDAPYGGGVGKSVITAFDPMAGGEPLPDGRVLVTEIPDSSGVAHKIVAVQVDGEWTWQIAD